MARFGLKLLILQKSNIKTIPKVYKTEDLIAYVEEAKTKGTIAVFIFHRMGGGYLNVGAKEHRELVQYLSEHRDEFYIATFAEVMDYITTNL